MYITYQNDMRYARRFLQGGPMEAPLEGAPVEEAPEGEAPQEGAPEEGAPEEGVPEGGEQDPMMQIALLFQQGLQNQDCQALAQGAQMFLLLLEQSQGGSAQPQQAEPVFRRGGILAYRIRK